MAREVMQVRLEPGEKQEWDSLAKRSHLKLTWLVKRAVRAAEEMGSIEALESLVEAAKAEPETENADAGLPLSDASSSSPA